MGSRKTTWAWYFLKLGSSCFTWFHLNTVQYHCSLFSVSMVPCSLGFRVYLNVFHKSWERSLG
jgi:hypothetical protein